MAEKHALLTGPIKGPVRLPDGTEVDVTPAVLEFDSQDEAAEVAHAIGQHWAKHGHPDDFDIEDGERVQRPFVYDDSNHKAHSKKRKG